MGAPVESLPPATGTRALVPAEGDWVGLSVQLARRGASRPVLVGRQAGRRREITIGAQGLWRWAFRGGPSADVYRAMVAASVSWLLGAPDRGAADATPARMVVEQGMPLIFERSLDSTVALPISFESGGTTQLDTLRFAGDGRASVWLAPGVYRYRLGGRRGGSGSVAVDVWSREWLPRPPTVTTHPPAEAGIGARRTAQQLPGLYLIVLLGLAGEWWSRRRLGLR